MYSARRMLYRSTVETRAHTYTQALCLQLYSRRYTYFSIVSNVIEWIGLRCVRGARAPMYWTRTQMNFSTRYVYPLMQFNFLFIFEFIFCATQFKNVRQKQRHTNANENNKNEKTSKKRLVVVALACNAMKMATKTHCECDEWRGHRSHHCEKT